MTETMNSETIWFLKEMVARSEKDFVEGRTYSHDAVKEMLKARTTLTSSDILYS